MEKFVADTKQVIVDFDPFKGPVIERILPTTEAQREVYVASVMGVDANCAYNESVSLILTGKLDRASLELALIDLVRRHEALRAICMELSNDELLSHTFEAQSARSCDFGQVEERTLNA